MEPTERAIRQLYEKEFDQLVRHASYMVGSPEVAEELVQEAFIRLMTKPPRETGRLAAWLRTVVSHLALDYLRRAKVEERVTEKVQMDISVASVEETTLGRLDRERIRQSLERLNPRDRQALILRHSGYSYREIAQALHCPADQVGVILIRALKKLRLAYEESTTPVAKEAHA
ncbi:RNA polymerase, sigma-24 subunit, ECF subfamily [Sulfobacillus acidophilus TPY]|uniref:RNA polymerase, sigma-24 subunit, ECF subfamily n=1 Tax=Sulfobacillus acidophilus (strain ATCC 700253 / DSM 10332 / NAL) TaxID=679936 RepID=G8TUU1_SULAD|nr:RNA polymerase, sigma-24 subunit, ECF subfamily [Sulfobacillus acidophilus TPY]AEW05815.1 RNA polymerase, sigma-24 subunit, ECF subfamily [Sulfobacillus acidophilus DSM 10332]